MHSPHCSGVRRIDLQLLFRHQLCFFGGCDDLRQVSDDSSVLTEKHSYVYIISIDTTGTKTRHVPVLSLFQVFVPIVSIHSTNIVCGGNQDWWTYVPPSCFIVLPNLQQLHRQSRLSQAFILSVVAIIEDNHIQSRVTKFCDADADLPVLGDLSANK